MMNRPMTHWRRVLGVGCLAGVAVLSAAPPATAHPLTPCVTGCVTAVVEQDTAGDGPFGVSPGGREGEWFSLGDQLGHIDRSGRTTTYDLPSADAGAGCVTRDPARGT